MKANAQIKKRRNSYHDNHKTSDKNKIFFKRPERKLYVQVKKSKYNQTFLRNKCSKKNMST